MSLPEPIAADLAVAQVLVEGHARRLRSSTARRDDAIRRARLDGATLEEIASATGLTIARVSQIARTVA